MSHTRSLRIAPTITRVLCMLSIIGAFGCRSSCVESDAGYYPGFDGYERVVSTESPTAQRYFNQGIQLLYGFNHDEAIRSFRRAADTDDRCAMAWWGIAYASGLHINNPVMSEQQSKQGYEASREALARIDECSPVEQTLIEAVAQRYAMPIPEDRTPLDLAYADAMQKAWGQFPNDPDVGALYAESLMNLQPWDLWTREGSAKGRTVEIVATLERVLEIRPDHPGANHFYIHTVEASPHPEKAVPSAKRLATLVPGSGHLVHMPAHIFARVGRWADASESNERAIAADRAYFALAPEPDFYSLYYVHNLHFLAWSAMMEGRYAVAMEAARSLQREIPESFLRDWTAIADGFMPVGYHVMIRFGKWDQILAEPAPPEYRLVSVALWRYARGIAFSATGRIDEAERELDRFREACAQIPNDWKIGNNNAQDVMKVALGMFMGELAYRHRDYDKAFALLRGAVEFEDALNYDEPPGWMQPVRHALGALLIGAGRHAEAEQVYRADLKTYANNGWSMIGLEKALSAQGKTEEAAHYAKRRAKLWAKADVKPTSSCYCEPGR